MDLGIRGKTALVTAASGGMGRNIALALAAEGVNVALFARSRDKLQEIGHEIERKHSVRAVAIAGDMLVRKDVEQLASTMERELSSPDILVLLTGRPPNPIRATLDEVDEERWQQAYQNQLWAAIQVTSRILPLMMGRGWGRILAVTSASVKQPMPHHSLSTVFRAGVTAYMKHLANEVAANGITVNCVAPALIDTSHRVGTAAYTEAQSEARKKLTPLGRMGTQEEFASVVAFLASVQAGFITGASIQVEGGMIGALL